MAAAGTPAAGKYPCANKGCSFGGRLSGKTTDSVVFHRSRGRRRLHYRDRQAIEQKGELVELGELDRVIKRVLKQARWSIAEIRELLEEDKKIFNHNQQEEGPRIRTKKTKKRLKRLFFCKLCVPESHRCPSTSELLYDDHLRLVPAKGIQAPPGKDVNLSFSSLSPGSPMKKSSIRFKPPVAARQKERSLSVVRSNISAPEAETGLTALKEMLSSQEEQIKRLETMLRKERDDKKKVEAELRSFQKLHGLQLCIPNREGMLTGQLGTPRLRWENWKTIDNTRFYRLTGLVGGHTAFECMHSLVLMCCGGAVNLYKGPMGLSERLEHESEQVVTEIEEMEYLDLKHGSSSVGAQQDAQSTNRQDSDEEVESPHKRQRTTKSSTNVEPTQRKAGGKKKKILSKAEARERWQKLPFEKPDRMTSKDQLFATLMLLHSGHTLTLAAALAAVHKSTMGRLMVSWLVACRHTFQILFPVPSAKNLKRHFPPQWKKIFGSDNIRYIIDSTNIQVHCAHDPKVRRALWSHYYKMYCGKALLALSPSGLIVWCSQVFPGHISDRELAIFGFLIYDLFEDGDDIMADKGFLILDLLYQIYCSLLVPTVKSRGDAWFTAAQSALCKIIANKRIHSERMMQRVKTWRWLTQAVPIDLLDTLSDALYVCAMLSNFLPGITDREMDLALAAANPSQSSSLDPALESCASSSSSSSSSSPTSSSSSSSLSSSPQFSVKIRVKATAGGSQYEIVE